MRLSGPNGELRTTEYPEISQIFHSFRKFDPSKTQILSVTMIPHGALEDLEKSTIPRFLPMCNLRTLTLTRVDNLPFIQAFKLNESCTVLFAELKELYIEELDWYCVEELKEMVREWNQRLSSFSITIVGLGEPYARSDVLSLRRYVSRLSYRAGGLPPERSTIFTTNHLRSNRVAPPRNHGFHDLENTFSLA